MSATAGVLAALLCGCSGGAGSSTGGVPATIPTSTPASSATPTATPAATPTATPAATPTATPAATPTAMPTATPIATPAATSTATPAPIPVLGSPSTLSFTAAGQVQTFTASESGFAGAFAVSGCTGIVTAGSQAPNGPVTTFGVTAVAAGTCNLTVQGAPGSAAATVAVTVTTLSGTIQ
jgi:hypothetical protein